MLLLAPGETWIVTIWQPIPIRVALDWLCAVANWFAFPYTVILHQDEQLEIYARLVVIITCGNLPLVLLESPTVIKGSADMVFWFAQTRLLAFRIIFSIHLIALLLFMIILTSVDVVHRQFHGRATTKHQEAAMKDSRPFEGGTNEMQRLLRKSHKELSFSVEAQKISM